MITQQDIGLAEDEHRAAIQALADAELLVKLGTSPSTDTGIAWASARGQVEQATRKLVGLREELAEQQVIAEKRAAAEKDQAKSIGKRVKDLDASEQRIAAALSAAQAALIDALDAVTDHNALLAESAGELAAQGFVGFPDGAGTGADPRKPLVRVGDRWWQAITPGVLLDMFTMRVRWARLDPRCYQVRVNGLGRGNMTMRAAADLLARVIEPECLPAPPRIEIVSSYERPVVTDELRRQRAVQEDFLNRLEPWDRAAYSRRR